MKPALRSLLCIAVLLALPGLSPAIATEQDEQKTIRFNVSPKGYPPFTIIQPDGSHGGIVWELLTLTAKRHGYQIIPVEIPRKRVDSFILEGHIDGTARAIEWTTQPERFLFTDPLLEIQEVFFKRCGSDFRFTGVDSVAGKTIITRLGYQYPVLEPLFATGLAERFDVQHDVDMFRYLASGQRFDLAVAVLPVGLWHIRRQGWKDRIDYAPEPLSSQGYRLMFSKEHQHFVDVFNDELEKMKDSGELEDIFDRYR